jgi:hypothetical protein
VPAARRRYKRATPPPSPQQRRPIAVLDTWRSDVPAVGVLAVAVKLDLGRLLAVIAAILRARGNLAFAAGVRAFVLLVRFSHWSPPFCGIMRWVTPRGRGYLRLRWSVYLKGLARFRGLVRLASRHSLVGLGGPSRLVRGAAVPPRLVARMRDASGGRTADALTSGEAASPTMARRAESYERSESYSPYFSASHSMPSSVGGAM